MSHKVDEEVLHEVFDALLKSSDVQAVELYESLKSRLGEHSLKDPDAFYFSLIYPHEKVLRGLLRQAFPGCGDNVIFLMCHGQFIDHHLERLFERKEGRACCCDKANACLSALLKSFVTGKPVEFDYEGEYTFHLPDLILKSHAERLSFFQAMKNLYYGRPDEYLQQLQSIMAPTPTATTAAGDSRETF